MAYAQPSIPITELPGAAAGISTAIAMTMPYANTPTVLAHDKDAATQGGFVLLRDGTVKRMSAAEFQAAYPVH